MVTSGLGKLLCHSRLVLYAAYELFRLRAHWLELPWRGHPVSATDHNRATLFQAQPWSRGMGPSVKIQQEAVSRVRPVPFNPLCPGENPHRQHAAEELNTVQGTAAHATWQAGGLCAAHAHPHFGRRVPCSPSDWPAGVVGCFHCTASATVSVCTAHDLLAWLRRRAFWRGHLYAHGTCATRARVHHSVPTGPWTMLPCSIYWL